MGSSSTRSSDRYVAEQVQPLLGDDAVYLGQVGGRQKAEPLAHAEALVNPIRWPEPFTRLATSRRAWPR